MKKWQNSSEIGDFFQLISRVLPVSYLDKLRRIFVYQQGGFSSAQRWLRLENPTQQIGNSEIT